MDLFVFSYQKWEETARSGEQSEMMGSALRALDSMWVLVGSFSCNGIACRGLLLSHAFPSIDNIKDVTRASTVFSGESTGTEVIG